MSAGILQSRYISKVFKARTPQAYCLAIHELVLYEMNVLFHNTNTLIHTLVDKYT